MDTHVPMILWRHMNRNKFNVYSHSLDTHEMHMHMYTQCSLRTGCDFVSARVCMLVAFFQVVPHTQCVWWASTNSSCVASKYSVLRTTSILILVHTVSRTVSLSPSHRVVYLAHTVLLTSVLLLPSLSLAQCTRCTLFISSHTSRRNVFLRVCITPRSHSVFFIVVAV